MLTNVKMFVFMYHVAMMLQCSFVATYELQLTHHQQTICKLNEEKSHWDLRWDLRYPRLTKVLKKYRPVYCNIS